MKTKFLIWQYKPIGKEVLEDVGSVVQVDVFHLEEERAIRPFLSV